MFRSLGKSKIGFVLAILFGVSLLFFKSGSRYSNLFNSDAVIATVSGTPISTTKFNRTMQMNIDRFNQMLGKPMSSDEIKAFQINSLALSALINDAAFEDEFDNNKFVIDEQVIALKTKERIPQLYDKVNNLNEEYLKTFLNQQQLKIEDIVQIINFETRNAFFSDAFFDTSYPLIFSNKIKQYNEHERKVSYLELDLENVSIDEIIKTEYSSNLKDELQSYYNAKKNNYMSDEKRDIEYLFLDKNIFKEQFTPTKIEIEDYYNDNKELFFEEEKRSFLQFNFKTLEEIQKFKENIKNLNTKEIIQFSKSQNFKFNEFKKLGASEILDEISKELFKLKVEEQSKIIETALAKHIVILLSIKDSSQNSLENVKKKINETIINIDTDNYFNELSNQISEKILNGSSLESISKSFNLKLNEIKKLTKTFSDYDIDDELLFLQLKESSFSSNKDFVSNIIKLNNNESIIINVSEIYIATPIDYEEIATNVLSDWTKEKKIEKIAKLTKENELELSFLSDLSNQYNAKSIDLIINKNSSDLPRNVINKIFSSKKNINIQVKNNQKLYIFKAEEIILPSQKNEYPSININEDLRVAFGQEIMKNKKISTNESLMSALLDQY